MYKRIVFFQPSTTAKSNYQNADGKEQCWAPWFALTLSPIARTWGIEVELIDARTQENWKDRVSSLTDEDVLAVSVMTGHTIVDAIESSTIAKNCGAYVIWGGPHVTLFPMETLEESPADAIISGFGFDPFWKFVEFLVNPDCQDVYSGKFSFKELPINRTAAPLKQSSQRKVYRKNNGLLPFDLHLVPDWSKYVNPDVAIASRTVNFITSEGCPRPCTFCSEPSTSKNIWLTRSIEQSIDTCVELLEMTNANGLKLHDPNFFHNKERALEFAKGIAQYKRIPWAATIHPADLNAMPDEILTLFRDTGLSRVLIGLESPYPRVIRMAGKKYDAHLIPDMAKRLANLGIRGMFTFIVGWPNTDISHYEGTIKCAYNIKQIWSEHQSKIHFLEPWPGTPIYQLLVRQGFKYPSSLSEWAEIDYYQAQFMQIHDQSIMEAVKNANSELSPYVSA